MEGNNKNTVTITIDSIINFGAIPVNENMLEEFRRALIEVLKDCDSK